MKLLTPPPRLTSTEQAFHPLGHRLDVRSLSAWAFVDGVLSGIARKTGWSQ
jgi:hypothetical protein